MYKFFLLITFPILFFSCKKSEKDVCEKERKNYVDLVKNHPLQKRIRFTKEERKSMGLPPNKYFEQEYLLEIDPKEGRTFPENLLKIQKKNRQLKKGISKKSPGESIDNNWVERGPNNIGGRTRVLLFDPNDSNHKTVFAGGISGGLWKNTDITDANTIWTRVGIDENIAISCITVDPNNSMIWYAGTGESYTSFDGAGSGVWKTIDGGTTWSNIVAPDLTISPSQRFYTINDILAWDNNGTTELFMAVGRDFDYNSVGYLATGWYRSTDGGQNWIRVDFSYQVSVGESTETRYYEVNDIEVDVNNTIWVGTRKNIYSQGGGKVFNSTDGLNFTEKYSFPNGQRVEISCSKMNANVLYGIAEVNTPPFPFGAPFVSIIKTTDAFATGASPETESLSLPNDSDTGISADDFTRGQAFYNLMIEVDPAKDSVVYVGGIDLFRTSDSGTNWKQISKWSNNNNLGALGVSTVHADQHEMVFRPSTSNNEAIFGNDGGVYYASTLSGASASTSAISSRNKGYNVTQFYSGAINQDNTNELFLGGTQDNGSLFAENTSAGQNSFVDTFGGDGAYEFIDKDGAYMIVSYLYNTYAALNLPYTGGGFLIANDLTSGDFINPAELDDTKDILFASAVKSGKDSIAKYTDLTSSPVRTNFTDPLLTGKATAFKVSPFTTTSTTLLVGTFDGKVLKVTDADTTPVWTDITGTINVGSISSINFGANESEILVTLHNYGVDNIWFTIDGGQTWTSKEGDFPDIPVKAILMNPLDNEEVIIGTNLGVWQTDNFRDASPVWTQSQNGMTNVKVTSFDLRTSDNTVLASTYGRGLFTGTFFQDIVLSSNTIDVNSNTIISIYPTVVKDKINIHSLEDFENTTIMVYDFNGNNVYSNYNVNLNQQESKEISLNLKEGIYILSVQNGKKILKRQKILIRN